MKLLASGKSLIVGTCAVALTGMSASAATIASWGTAGSTTSLAANFEGAGVSADNLEAGEGLDVRNDSAFNFDDWDTASVSSADALAANDFWTWGFESSSAYDLTDFSIRLDRSGAGPDDFLIELAINGSGSFVSVLSHDFQDSANGVNFLNVDLSGFDSVTDADFRLTAFNSESAAGTFDLELLPSSSNGIIITGEVSAVPLPAPALMLLAGLFGLGALRFRRSA